MTHYKFLNHFFIICGIFILHSSFNVLYAAGQDNIIINHIKSRSNLTDSDINKWKFLWLKSFAEPMIGGISALAAYKAGTLAQNIPSAYDEMITNVIQGQNVPQFVKFTEPWIKNEWIWTGVSTLGVGLAAYKLLYPRVQMGIIAKIKAFDTLCKNLVVANNKYNTKSDFINALSKPGNALWQHGSILAQEKGIQNLIDQANIAIALIDQLLASGGNFNIEYISELRNRIQSYRENLLHNETLISGEAAVERGIKMAKDVWKGAQYVGGLLVAGTAAWVTARKIQNLRMQWDLTKDIAKEGRNFIDYGWPWLKNLFNTSEKQTIEE